MRYNEIYKSGLRYFIFSFRMFSYTLCKSEVSYWGSDGPGTCRIMKVTYGDKTYLLQENLDISENKPSGNRNPKYPVEMPVSLPESVNEECEKYISAYETFEAARAEFKKAKQIFDKSLNAKPIKQTLIPQTGPLSLDQVINNEDVDALTKLVQEIIGPDNLVTSVRSSVEGYDIGIIVMKTEKPIPMKLIEPLKYNEYKWSKYDYTTKCISPLTDTTNRFIFMKKGGSQYPPFRIDDYKEITRK